MSERVADLVKTLIDRGVVDRDTPIEDCEWIPTKIRNAMAREWITRRHPQDIPAPFRRLLSVTDNEILDFPWIGSTELRKFKDAMLNLLGIDPNKELKEVTKYAGMPEQTIELWQHYHLTNGEVLSEQYTDVQDLPEGAGEYNSGQAFDATGAFTGVGGEFQPGWMNRGGRFKHVFPDGGSTVYAVNSDHVLYVRFEARIRPMTEEEHDRFLRNKENRELRAIAKRVVLEEGAVPAPPACPMGCGHTLEAHEGADGKHLFCHEHEVTWDVPGEMSEEAWENARVWWDTQPEQE